MPTLDFIPALAQEKLRLVGHDDETGLPMVQTESGEAFKFDPRQYAKAKYNQDLPADAKFQFNSPDSPVQDSPVPLMARAALETLHDEKSKIAQLQKRYGEVIPHKEFGLVINNNGVYQAYSPSVWDTKDPRDLAAAIVEQAPKAIIAAAAAIPFAAAGAPVALTALGAGLLAGTVRTSFGKYVGTYTATPEERIQDIGLEGLMNLGGVYIGPGIKNTVGPLIKGMTNIAKSASSATKTALSGVFGELTGAGAKATRNLIERSPAVMGLVNKFAAGAETTEAAITGAVQKAASVGRSWLETGIKALPKQYAAGLQDIAEAAEKSQVTVNMDDVIMSAKAGIDKLNFGRFKNTTDEASGRLSTVFHHISETEKASQGIGDLPEGAQPFLNRIVRVLNRYHNDGELTGSAAVKRLSGLNKALNEIKYDMPIDATPAVQRVVNEVTGAVKNTVGQQMADSGLGEGWTALNNTYKLHSDAIDYARTLLNSPNGVYTLLDKAFGTAGKERAAGDVVSSIQTLAGKEGEALFQNMLDHYSAAKFLPWAPRLGMKSLSAGSVGITGAVATGHPLVAAVIAATGAAASSPRVVAKGLSLPGRIADRASRSAAAKALPSVEKFQDFLRNMSPQDRQIFLQNPAYVSEAYETMKRAVGSVDQHTQTLMQGAQAQIQNAQSGQQNGPRR